MKEGLDEIIMNQPASVRDKVFIEDDRILIPNMKDKNELKKKITSMEKGGKHDVKNSKTVLTVSSNYTKIPLASVRDILRNARR